MIADDPSKHWGVRELARALRISPSGTYRILSILRQERLVQDEPGTGRYYPTLDFFRLASRVAALLPFRQVALPIMQRLVSKCNETTLFGLYDPMRMEMMFIASVESSHPLRYVVDVNKWLPVYAGASGLAVMAFLSEMERRAIVARTNLAPITDRTITDPDRLEEEMARIRRRGYACSIGQRTPGSVGIAAPVWGVAGRVLGELVLTIPEQRFDPKSEKMLGALLIHHAGAITEQICGNAGGAPDLNGTHG